MHIEIVYTCGFPYGEATTNRIISYAKELAKDNYVNVIALYPYYSKVFLNRGDQKPDVSGSFEGINYIYPAGFVTWPEHGKRLLYKICMRVKALCCAFAYVRNNRHKIDVLQIYSLDTHVIFFFAIVAWLFCIPYVAERSELPSFIKNPLQGRLKIVSNFRKKIAEFSFSLFDGWFLETQQLADYFMKYASPKAKLCIVPMTVDIERFQNVHKSVSTLGRYVAYCGSMNECDGISILIEAFALVVKVIQDVNLVLAGNSADTDNQKKLVRKKQLDDRIVFLGRIPSEEVPYFLTNAETLVLASPLSIRASVSMPCKVGEYLCTGNPVVVTGQGEILRYLEDGVSAYLPTPDSIENLANKIILSLTDVHAKEIGMRGKDVTYKYFSSKAQVNKILSFYNELIQLKNKPLK